MDSGAEASATAIPRRSLAMPLKNGHNFKNSCGGR